MSVTWLRGDHHTEAGDGSGERIVRAVTAWVSEWIPEIPREVRLPYVLWIGCSTSERVGELCRELASRIPHLHIHPSDAGRR